MGVVIERDPVEVPVDFMVARHDGDVYVFAVAMRGVPVRAVFEIHGLGSARKAETIGADGEIEITGGGLELEFEGWEAEMDSDAQRIYYANHSSNLDFISAPSQQSQSDTAVPELKKAPGVKPVLFESEHQRINFP